MASPKRSRESALINFIRTGCYWAVPLTVVATFAYSIGVQHGQNSSRHAKVAQNLLRKDKDKNRSPVESPEGTVVSKKSSARALSGASTTSVKIPQTLRENTADAHESSAQMHQKIGNRDHDQKLARAAIVAEEKKASNKNEQELRHTQVAMQGKEQESASSHTSNACKCNIGEVLPHHSIGGQAIDQVCTLNQKNVFTQSQPSAKKRFALLVRGESFRGFQGMYDRHIDVNAQTFDCQEKACKSHVDNIIKPLEACGYAVDVFLVAWQAHDKKWGRNSSQMLIDMYHGRVVAASFAAHGLYERIGLVPGRITPQAMKFSEGLATVADYSRRNGVSWDAVLIIRFDLIFKQPLKNMDYQKVMFAFREWELLAGNYVADTIHYWPWKYMNCAVLEGFREHFSGGVRDRIGNDNMGFFTTELHDANSMADRNPIYRMCRPEQKHEINGGFAILVFGLSTPSPLQIEAVGLSVRRALYLQAEPRSLAPSDIVAHTWVKDDKHREGIAELVRLRFGQIPAGMNFQSVLKSQNYSERYFKSLRNVTDMMTKTPTVRDRNIFSVAKGGHSFSFDRLVFIRNDYEFTLPEIHIYRCQTESEVCVGYGSSSMPQLPVLIISGHRAALRFLQAHASPGNMTKAGIHQYLEQAFRLPIRTFCPKC